MTDKGTSEADTDHLISVTLMSFRDDQSVKRRGAVIQQYENKVAMGT